MIRRSWTQAASIEETLALWAASLREVKKRHPGRHEEDDGMSSRVSLAQKSLGEKLLQKDGRDRRDKRNPTGCRISRPPISKIQIRDRRKIGDRDRIRNRPRDQEWALSSNCRPIDRLPELRCECLPTFLKRWEDVDRAVIINHPQSIPTPIIDLDLPKSGHVLFQKSTKLYLDRSSLYALSHCASDILIEQSISRTSAAYITTPRQFTTHQGVEPPTLFGCQG
jgi:hypothetical protein